MASRLLRPRDGVTRAKRVLNSARGRSRLCRQFASDNYSTASRIVMNATRSLGRVGHSAVLIAGRRELSCSSVLRGAVGAEGGHSDGELLKETPTFAESQLTTQVSSADGNEAATAYGSSADVASSILAVPTEDFAELGLGGYTPPGLVQSALEFLHNNAHLPWWASIVAATVALRVALFPLAVRMQVNAAKIANINPIAQEMHKRMVAYKNIGNRVAEAQEAAKLMAVYREQGVHPITTLFMMPLVQIPVFISFFLAIKGMAKLPLESMKTGGIYWFTDLTVPDPTYVLPLAACLTFISNIELGGEGGAASSNQTHRNLKMFMRASAVLVLPISISFPSGLFMYWVTNSLFSTCQILFLKIPKVKQFFGIPKIVRPPEQS